MIRARRADTLRCQPPLKTPIIITIRDPALSFPGRDGRPISQGCRDIRCSTADVERCVRTISFSTRHLDEPGITSQRFEGDGSEAAIPPWRTRALTSAAVVGRRTRGEERGVRGGT
ncbi:hypothetical protein AAFF_G00317070 [Aldrovandia affinis]|uniref:Uncharacterized protein n=1 Tax=Aldrovandia affinis TaxID=143900 RepID=A0AAD7R7R9_9TELE|nr:hypothetical protein AAFF_G00317070 [Aldrovandia affinis]